MRSTSVKRVFPKKSVLGRLDKTGQKLLKSNPFLGHAFSKKYFFAEKKIIFQELTIKSVLFWVF